MPGNRTPKGRAVIEAILSWTGAPVRVEEVRVSDAAAVLDVGTGIPTAPNVHETARAINPGARIVYVDIDPVAVELKVVKAWLNALNV